MSSKKTFWQKTLGNDKFLIITVCFLMAGKRLALLQTDLNYEEGKDLQGILNILSGNLIYRDFYWQYGPGAYYLLAGFTKVLGELHVWIPRLFVTFIATFTTYLSYRISRFFLNPSWAFWASLMSSSGLAARENSYGHSLAYLGMIGSLYFLLRFILKGEERKSLVVAGIFIFIAMTGKPVVFGVGALLCGFIILIIWARVHKKHLISYEVLSPMIYFAVIPSFLLYGFFLWKTSFSKLIANLFPMTSGSFLVGKFFLKSPFPSLSAPSLIAWLNNMNSFLNNNLRWWLIVITLIGGGLITINKIIKYPKNVSKEIPIILLLIYGLLIEMETLILARRPITFYINMLPNYILLGILFAWLKKIKWFFRIRALAFFMVLYYFFYPPLRLGWHHYIHGYALTMKYAEGVRVSEYTFQGYQNIVRFIKKTVPANKPIIFAGYNGFIHLFSGHQSLFPEDDVVFTRVSFSPYHSEQPSYSSEFYQAREQEIIARIEKKPPPIIMIPSFSINSKNLKRSVFLKYLLENWRLTAVLNDHLHRGPFDHIDLEMNVYIWNKNPDKAS